MCKIVKDIQQVVVTLDTDSTVENGNSRILELEAKGYQMFFAPVNVNGNLVYTLTLIQELEVKDYEKIVQESIKAL